MKVINCTREEMLVEHGIVAARPWARLRGLLGRSALSRREGLLLIGTKAIHTIGMRFPIDVAFLDCQSRVIHVIHSLPPFRFSPHLANSMMVLELPAGVLQATRTEIGDRIEVILTNDSTAVPERTAAPIDRTE
jgi:uncharacterized membrane protein (UPF0127 family)